MNGTEKQGSAGGTVPTLFVEFDPPEPCPHAFAGASLLLRGESKIELRPLLTFEL